MCLLSPHTTTTPSDVCGFFSPQAILWHELGVLEFNSVLTLAAWGCQSQVQVATCASDRWLEIRGPYDPSSVSTNLPEQLTELRAAHTDEQPAEERTQGKVAEGAERRGVRPCGAGVHRPLAVGVFTDLEAP